MNETEEVVYSAGAMTKFCGENTITTTKLLLLSLSTSSRLKWEKGFINIYTFSFNLQIAERNLRSENIISGLCDFRQSSHQMCEWYSSFPTFSGWEPTVGEKV